MAKKSTIQAYAIHKIGLGRVGNKKRWVEASTKTNPSVFPIDETTFENLKQAGAVREATKEEIALSKVRENQVETEVATPVLTEANVVTDDSKPKSGADGDPQNTPKGATKKDDAADKAAADKAAADKAAADKAAADKAAADKDGNKKSGDDDI